MGYVAVKGGTKAIEESIERLKYERVKHRNIIEVNDVISGMRGLIDQVMSEGSLYSRELAAIAIRQSEGNIEEAVFLLRAYRSTLKRLHYTRTVETEDMWVERRISASFKDILGGQILGATYDYTHRLIDFDILSENEDEVEKWIDNFKNKEYTIDDNIILNKLPKVLDYLRKEGIVENCEKSEDEPADVTKKSLEFPSIRSERLQILTRGLTGGINSLAYSALRTSGFDEHPTVGELRVGEIPLYIQDPITNNFNIDDDYYIGEVQVTEVESFIPHSIKGENGENIKELEVGYGMCFGQNETKAISMSILDNCLNRKNKKYPTGDEEFVLLSIDSVESSGFISHLKLPHYVTFQSKLDSIRKTRKGDRKQ